MKVIYALTIVLLSLTLCQVQDSNSPLSRLNSRLQKLLDGRSDKTVLIKAPRKMSYGDVLPPRAGCPRGDPGVKVIDIAKGVGAQPIGLQIDHLQ